MTDEEKIYQAYYQPDRLWTGGKAIKKLHKITSMSKKDIKSCFTCLIIFLKGTRTSIS